MRKRPTITIFSCLILVVLGLWYLSTRDIVITLTNRDIQDRLNAAFPIEKIYLGVVDVTLSHPAVALQEGSDRVNFSVDADVNALSNVVRIHGTGDISGKVRFDQRDGRFYLDEPNVEKFQIDGVPKQYQDAVKSGANFAVKPLLDNHPIYTLKRPVFSGFGIALTLQSARVKDGILRITLSPRK